MCDPFKISLEQQQQQTKHSNKFRTNGNCRILWKLFKLQLSIQCVCFCFILCIFVLNVIRFQYSMNRQCCCTYAQRMHRMLIIVWLVSFRYKMYPVLLIAHWFQPLRQPKDIRHTESKTIFDGTMFTPRSALIESMILFWIIWWPAARLMNSFKLPEN